MNFKKAVFALGIGLSLITFLVGCATTSGVNPAKEKETVDVTALNDAERRAYYLDFAMKYRFDYVPVFEENAVPASSADYLWYAFALNLENWDFDNLFMTKDYVESVITTHFEVKEVVHETLPRNWIFDGERYTPMPQSYKHPPIFGLQTFQSDTKDSKTIYEVVLNEYEFDEFVGIGDLNSYQLALDDNAVDTPGMAYVIEKKGDKIKSGELTVFEAIREMICEGDTEKFYIIDTARFKYYLDENSGDPVFIEHAPLDAP